jgi:hypothetical protein
MQQLEEILWQSIPSHFFLYHPQDDPSLIDGATFAVPEYPSDESRK